MFGFHYLPEISFQEGGIARSDQYHKCGYCSDNKLRHLGTP